MLSLFTYNYVTSSDIDYITVICNLILASMAVITLIYSTIISKRSYYVPLVTRSLQEIDDILLSLYEMLYVIGASDDDKTTQLRKKHCDYFLQGHKFYIINKLLNDKNDINKLISEVKQSTAHITTFNRLINNYVKNYECLISAMNKASLTSMSESLKLSGYHDIYEFYKSLGKIN